MKWILTGSVLIGVLAGCTSHHFVNKTGQSDKQFIQDKAYCQGLATGQSESRPEGERLIPYDECMRNLGYEIK
ncbi:hypothetical protein [Thiomicrorhabdus chilensis]|uniref:hypothetical protein n=1 Tax=Thiomicrorhabdus chilensis TaxID=63656 RepID=UPI0003F60788|nr:hypothetical protein [Thiomicrorhabdus chilensis]